MNELILKFHGFKPPLTSAPSSASIMGVFGNRLFEPSDLIGEFPIDAHDAEQHRKQAEVGCPFVWLLYFGQAK